jgi:glycogen synthase
MKDRAQAHVRTRHNAAVKAQNYRSVYHLLLAAEQAREGGVSHTATGHERKAG